MSDITPPDRDESGRFKSARPVETAVDDPAAWHPLARALFGWTTGARAGQGLFWGVITLGALLVLADALVSHKVKFDIQSTFGFYGLFGGLAFALVILAGWPLARFLRRDEDYYGDAENAEERAAREER